MNCSATGCDDLAEVRGLCWNDYQRLRAARWRCKLRAEAQAASAEPTVTRDDCPTCAAKRDEHGRLEIGWCGPDCLMAKVRRGEA